jgi:hypothetical protein
LNITLGADAVGSPFSNPRVGMNSQDRRTAYLAKAKDAQQQAERFMDRDQKESWLRIAQGYLILARGQEAVR